MPFEDLPEQVVSEIGQRPAVGLAPGWNASAGMSRVVTSEEPMSITLMMSAAVVRSLRALRIRPVGASWVSVGSPATSGMTTTPVSNPDRPSARAGKTSSAAPMIPKGAECALVIASTQSGTSEACAATWSSPSTMTTADNPR